jgi:hypothetical protein
MKTLFFSFLSLFSYTVFAQPFEDDSIQKHTFLKSFTEIKISDGIDLFLTQGNEESVNISASDAKYLERFKTEIDNGVLKIYYDSKGLEWPGNSKRKLTAYVTFKKLNKIEASGGAEVTAKNNVALNDIILHFYSGSAFNGQLNVNNLIVNQNSGSNINISGKALIVKIEASVGAVFKGFDLQADVCEAKVNTAAVINITVNKELSAKAATAGSIHYKGKGVITNIKTSSAGVVKKQQD